MSLGVWFWEFWDTFATNEASIQNIEQVEGRGLLTFHGWKVTQQPHVQCVPQSQGNETGVGEMKSNDVKVTSKLKSSDVSHLRLEFPADSAGSDFGSFVPVGQ